MRRWLGLAALMLAGSAPALAEDAARPAARVEANAVIQPSDPMLAVRVPANATYVGAERFTLYGVADCEIHLFVEADAQRRIRRLYWIQFESYLPSRPDARYDYGESDRRMELWGATAWARTFLIDTGRAPRAGSDTERVRAMLEGAGYTAAPYLMAVRLVRLLDDAEGSGYGRRELMLIYAEDMTPIGLIPADVTTDGQPNARWAPLELPLIDRATTAFQVEAR